MAYTYAIFGAGRQGVALAYDLALRGDAGRILLADVDEAAARAACERLRMLTAASAPRCAFEARRCDVGQAASVRSMLADLTGSRVAISAVPYRFNALLAEWAIDCGASFCDLGGNTDVVRRELALDARARARGVSVVPDCGLAPGLGNHLAAHGIETLEGAQRVRIYCGGLPAMPVGPLAYKLVFSFEGLINEYSGFGEYLRGGQRVDVPALTEIEEVRFPAPFGKLEAAVTSGGTSTCPATWSGRLDRYEYKTLRWPGHWAKLRALFELGAFDLELAARDGRKLEPRALLRELFEQRLAYPDVDDVVLLRVVVEAPNAAPGAVGRVTYDWIDRKDPATGFSAMERSTAFPAALVAHLQARGVVAPGASPLERSVPARQYFDELPAHEMRVRRRTERRPRTE